MITVIRPEENWGSSRGDATAWQAEAFPATFQEPRHRLQLSGVAVPHVAENVAFELTTELPADYKEQVLALARIQGLEAYAIARVPGGLIASFSATSAVGGSASRFDAALKEACSTIQAFLAPTGVTLQRLEETRRPLVTALEQKEKARYAVLRALYQVTNGRTHGIVPSDVLLQQTALDRESVDDALQYLAAEGLLEFRALGPSVGLTHQGVLEVEASLRNPSEPTEHFPPAIIQNFHGPVGIVQTGNQNTATLTVGTPLPELVPLIDAVVQAGANLPSAQRADLQEQIDDLRSELRSSPPKASRLKATLLAMWAATSQFAEIAPKLIELAEKLGLSKFLPK